MRRIAPRARKNTAIRAPKVRLIDQDGNNLGVVDTAEALEKARETGLDLIEITDKTEPPVARIMEYGKFIYEQEKKERAASKKQKDVNVIKGVRLSMRTSGNDLEFKAQTVDKFLKKGYKVRVEFVMRGREKALREIADKRIKEFLKVLTESYIMDQPPSKYPRGLSFTLSKKK